MYFMVSYLDITETFVSHMPYVAFKLYNSIIVPNCVDFDQLGSKRGVEFVVLRLSKKTSVI